MPERATVNASKIRSVIARLGLTDGEYVVGGSGVLALRGIRSARDVDLYVKERTFARLFEAAAARPPAPDERQVTFVCGGVDVVAMTDWKWDGYPIALQEALRGPEYVDDVPCVPLNYLLVWKQYAGSRPKDSEDVQLIGRYLAGGGV